jgi:hypothetical protein
MTVPMFVRSYNISYIIFKGGRDIEIRTRKDRKQNNAIRGRRLRSSFLTVRLATSPIVCDAGISEEIWADVAFSLSTMMTE